MSTIRGCISPRRRPCLTGMFDTVVFPVPDTMATSISLSIWPSDCPPRTRLPCGCWSALGPSAERTSPGFRVRRMLRTGYTTCPVYDRFPSGLGSSFHGAQTLLQGTTPSLSATTISRSVIASISAAYIPCSGSTSRAASGPDLSLQVGSVWHPSGHRSKADLGTI